MKQLRVVGLSSEGRETMKRLLSVLGIGLILAFTAACAPAAPAPAPAAPPPAKEAPAPTVQPTPAPKPLEKVSLRLDWLVVGYHAPYFVALDKGWYKDAGLDVSIGEGKGSGSTIQLVATGGDTFGFASGAVMARTVAQGGQVMMVLNIMPKGAEALVVREDSGIKTLKDMEGKSWGGAPSATTGQLLPALFKANGVDISKVQVVSVDNAVKTPGWLEKKYDAMSSLVNDELVRLDAQGVKYRAFPYGDHGVGTMGHGIVVNTKTIQEKPEVVKGFVEATLKGWKYAFENPQEAAKILTKLAPEAKQDEAITVAQLKATLPLTQTENTKGKPLGWMSEKDWQQTVDLLAQYADLKDKPAIDKLFTNKFIPNQ